MILCRGSLLRVRLCIRGDVVGIARHCLRVPHSIYLCVNAVMRCTRWCFPLIPSFSSSRHPHTRTPLHRAGARSILELPALSATHSFSQVVAAIRNGEVVEGSIGADGKPVDGHLRLPAGLSWPVATNNVLFVRKYYAALLEKVLGWCKAAEIGALSSTQRRIVSGQPGIGKSVWM